MDKNLKKRLEADPQLDEKTRFFVDVIEKADGDRLMKAIVDNDENGIASALGLSLDEVRSLGKYFHDVAVQMAESSPQLREAASYFGSKGGGMSDGHKG